MANKCWLVAFLVTVSLLSVVQYLSSIFADVVQRDTSPRRCTFVVFRQAYKQLGYFPGGGHWTVTNGVAHYQPSLCELRYRRVSNDFISRCLTKANVSYVLTLGDSTASRYNAALLKTSTLGFKRIRRERLHGSGFIPDKNYFARQIPSSVAKLIKEKFRFCRGCASNLNTARFVYENKSHTIDIEYLAQTMILDDSLEIVYPSAAAARDMLEHAWAITTQELIFRYYLKDRYPDVLLIFLPFVHAKHNIALSRLPIEIQYFKGLLEEFFPYTTKFVFLPAYSEFESARKNVSWWNHLFENILATDKINRMNHVLYDVIKQDLLETGGRYFGFLDLIEVSKDRAAWSIDGIHMQSVWYESIMTMFWQIYCNSVLLDEF